MPPVAPLVVELGCIELTVTAPARPGEADTVVVFSMGAGFCEAAAVSITGMIVEVSDCQESGTRRDTGPVFVW